MQVHVKTRHIKIDIEGKIPSKIIKFLKKEYGNKLEIIETDEDSVNVKDTDWYKKMNAKITPADYMKTYRQNKGWTQEQLGKKLGGIPRQHISNMENGHRAISIDVAEKLSKIFKKPVSRFL